MLEYEQRERQIAIPLPDTNKQEPVFPKDLVHRIGLRDPQVISVHQGDRSNYQIVHAQRRELEYVLHIKQILLRRKAKESQMERAASRLLRRYIPTPTVFAYLDAAETKLDHSYVISQFVGGMGAANLHDAWNIRDGKERLTTDERKEVLNSLVDTLLTIHSITPEMGEGFDRGLKVNDTARTKRRLFWAATEKGDHLLTYEQLKLARASAAASNTGKVLLHGDFWGSNIFVRKHDPTEIAGVVDLEKVHYGLPAQEASASLFLCDKMGYGLVEFWDAYAQRANMDENQRRILAMQLQSHGLASVFEFYKLWRGNKSKNAYEIAMVEQYRDTVLDPGFVEMFAERQQHR